ncbi:MAG: ABC transporter permease [Clostridia bacterium]|nr:ABC transporter permease [Clostridia bacterium]
MQIVFKFLIKNIWEKKFRTFLILFSVMMSSALFFSSIAISDNVVKMFLSQAKQRFGSAEIIIHEGEKSPTPFIYTETAKSYRDQMDYIIGVVQSVGFFKFNRDEKITVNIEGISIEDLQTMNPITLAEQVDFEPFKGDKIIISKNTAEKYSLKLGETLELDINKVKYRFKICGIAQPQGFFLEGGQVTNAVVPKETMASILEAPGKSNMIYIKLKDTSKTKEMINNLSKVYKRYIVEEPVSEEELRHETASISTGFMLMTVIVLFMGIFIIYTSFKVITMERLPVIGTFRSIGATRKTTDWVLLSESILYGILGGILGGALGIGILYLITVAITPPWMKDYSVKIEFTAIQLVSSLILAMVLSFISSIIPIIKVSKIPVKEIVLNKIEKQSGKKLWKPVLGIVFLVASFAIPPLAPKAAAMAIDTGCMLLATSAVILLVPYLTEGFVRVFETVYTVIFGNEGVLAAKNLRQNKSILNNISLLAIAISSLLMITTVSDSVMVEVTNFFTNNSTFDAWFYINEADRDMERQLLATEGVKDVYGNYEASGIDVIGKNEKISVVQGVRSDKFLEFLNTDIEGDRQALLNELETGRNIIITNMLREKFGVKKGDTLTLKMAQGERTYKIIGFHNTLLDNGNNAMIASKYFENDMGTHYYRNIFIKAKQDPEAVVSTLKKKFARQTPFVMSMTEMARLNSEMNSQVFNTMKGFSLMALLIGTFGIFNNFIISFIERKRSFAVLKSIGMSKRQIIKMMFIESLSGGVIGGAIGVLAGILTISVVPHIMKAMDQPIPIHYTIESMILAFILGTVITLLASISPATRSSKLNIIEAIKYE